MSELVTDFSTAPYFDDYDEEKKYYRILFNPRRAVQARELTQIQTILQRQISRFGTHVFKDGSIVDGCAIGYHTNMRFIHLENNFNGANLSSVTQIANTYLITNSLDSNTATRAVPVIVKPGFLSNYPDTNRIYLRYLTAGKDSNNIEQHKFFSEETLYIFNENQSNLGELDSNNVIDTINVITESATAIASGIAYAISVSSGIIYQKGHFLRNEAQIVTVKDFDKEVDNYVIGFETVESIVNSSQDQTLKDNASGFSNSNAPGADRLKLTPTLVSYFRDDAPENFFPIVQYDGQTPSQNADDPVYNKLGAEFARRTHENSGDFYVKPFQIETTVDDINPDFFTYEISPGISYIKGYRVEFIGTNRVRASRAIETDVAQNQIVTANYGKYIVANEFLGSPDISNLGEVEIYDQAQKSISEFEGISGGTAGALIGHANIKAIAYREGTKGKPDCSYFVYIFNIRMITSKSFANDAKSFVSTTTRGDFVLEDNIAKIKDVSNQTLIFDTGHRAVRRLTDENGVNDTSYTYKQRSTATLQANGFVTFTINTPAPGATESIAFSVGNVSAIGKRRFDIYLTANAFTSNSSGVLDVVSGNTIIIGANTSFNTEFQNDDLIRVNIDGSNFEIRRIENVINATAIEINAAITTSNNAANYQKYFVDGTILDLQNSTINVISNTQFQVSTDLELDSGSQTVSGLYPVLRNLALPSSKNIRKDRFVKIDVATNSNGTLGPWNLGLVDVKKIKNVWIGTDYETTNPDRSSWFILDNGQKDDFYEHSRLIIKPEFASRITNSTKLLVNLDHFVPNTSAGVGFFSVDSYPIDDANTANTSAVNTAEIPLYIDEEGTRYDLRNVLDFRPQKINTANSVITSDPANTFITENPANSNSTFNVATGGQYLIEADSNFRMDVEYYLSRIDLVTVGKDGNANFQRGTAKENPKTPFAESDISVIARATIPPYPSLTQREGELFNRPDLTIKIEPRGNKRYTMKAIGNLENRIKRLEYYTVLNTLEQRARDLTIPDENGLDRFKNGIFADPFNSHEIGKVTDFEYNIAIDKDENVARPKAKVHPIDFKFDSESSFWYQREGAYVTLPYTSVLHIIQPYATKFRNATELEWQWNGNLKLYPEQDYYREENFGPNINIDIDLATPWENFANSPFGSSYGDWRTVSTDRNSRTTTSSTAAGTTSSTTTTTTTNQERIVQETEIDILSNEYDFGSYITDFSIQPYMRSRTIAFIARNMKPNTEVFPFFDEKSVAEHCAPGVLSGIENTVEGSEENIVRRTGQYGESLITDDNGFISGKFRIPENSFRVGDRTFSLYGVDDLESGIDSIMTRATGIFHASSVSVTRQSATLSTREPRVHFTEDVQRRAQTNSTTSTTFTPTPIEEPRPEPVRPDPCPSPEMLVLLADGSFKMAGDLVIGDVVSTQHEDTLEWGSHEITYKEIVDSERVKIIFDSTFIVCSLSHKLYVDGKGWLEVTSLTEGDVVSGKVFVETVPHEDGPVVVLQVDTAHTYICQDLLSHNKQVQPPCPGVDVGAMRAQILALGPRTGCPPGQWRGGQNRGRVGPDDAGLGLPFDPSIAIRVVFDRNGCNGIAIAPCAPVPWDGHCGDPLAQSFVVAAPTNSSGAFFTEIGLFFRSKDSTLGCTVYVMEMRGGYPDQTNILGEAYLTSAEINAPGTNEQVETRFKFEQPIYLTKDTFYAFMIYPDGSSPEYTFWLSELGGTDVETGQPVNRNIYPGTAFHSSNKYTWTALQEEDIKFNMYRASFDNTASSLIFFENEDDEYLVVDNIIRANTSLGISIGDVVYTVNATSNNTIVSNTAPFGIVQLVNEAEGLIELDSSRGGFEESDIIRFYRVSDDTDETEIIINNLIATGTISELRNIPTHAVVPRISKMVPASTRIQYQYRGTDINGNLDTEFISVEPETETEFLDKERFIFSKSNEGADKSGQYRIVLSSDDNFTSPLIDLGRKASLHVENKINNDSSNEHTRYGNALAKYISKNVILADGQEAEDLRIYLTAYRPVDTNIEVYVKLQNPEDPEPFDSKLWTKLDYASGENLFSNPTDTKDYREFEFEIPTSAAFTNSAFRDPSTGIVEYENNDGSRFLSFKKYSIKIVLLSSNKIRVPRINNIRGIALQV